MGDGGATESQALRVEVDDGVGLHVLDEGSGRPVVLIAGYSGTTASWALTRRHLASQGYRVITYDRRSHGRSDRPATGGDLARHGRDLACVLDTLGLDRVDVVGSSMGASVVWAYVAEHGQARLHSVISVDQTPKMVNDETWAFGLYGLEAAGVDKFVDDFPSSVPNGGRLHPEPDEALLSMVAPDGPPFSYDDTRGLLHDHTRADWRPVIGGVTVPVLAVAGTSSPVWPSASSRWIADAMAGGSYVELDSGHVPFIERPAAFNAALDTFLAGGAA